ncbi:MAG: TolC family protein [Chitinophagales bacterium]|nr:TolC family protein [Chitinophagales bacterium]
MLTLKRIAGLLIASCSVCVCFAQNNVEISVSDLYYAAEKHYPLLEQKTLIAQQEKDKKVFLSANYLPQINITGSATYQSEVTEFVFPGMPANAVFQQKPDQYSLGLEIRQNLFDYGQIATEKKAESMLGIAQRAQIDAQWIGIKDRINNWVGIFILQKANKATLILRLQELDAKIRKAEAAVNNGVLLKSQLLQLQSEYLSTQQKLIECQTAIYNAAYSISVYTGMKADTAVNIKFQNTQAQPFKTNTNRDEYLTILRPEFRAFEAQTAATKLKFKSYVLGSMPKVFVFGRGYYGRPGFNFLNNDFRTYGLVGAGLSWNLNNYFTLQHQSSFSKAQLSLIEHQKEMAAINLNLAANQILADIQKTIDMIALDRQIVYQKNQIKETASNQLDNGIITASDYLTDLDGANQAELNLKLHLAQLELLKMNYLNAIGS